MAKSVRSSSKKAVKAQRRAKPKAAWQEEADRKRYEALAKAAGSAPLPLGISTVNNAAKAAEATATRGRTRTAQDSMETDAKPPASKARKSRKGVDVRGVQKTHNKKKVSPLWVSEFHKSRKGKKLWSKAGDQKAR